MNKVPKLRFKEFSGEWEFEKIGNITKKVGSGKTPKGGNTVYTDSGVIFLRSQNILNGILALNDVAYITEDENSKMKSTQVYGNDILLNITGASIGRSCIVPKIFPKANVNQHVCIIRLKENYNSYFIMNQILSYKVQKQIDSYQAGGNREGLNFQQIKQMNVAVTVYEEQQKIANFFSLIDKKIENQQEKVEALKDYKKGMMQKIFSQAIRFKGDNGEEYPEWEEKKAEKLFESISDKKHNGELEVLSATQDRGVIPRSELNIDIKYEESSLSSYKRVRKNNFIISLRSFQGGIETSKYDGLVSPAYTVFNFKENEKQNHDFFSLIFKSRNFINRLNTLIYGIRDGKAISFKDFAGVKLQYPCIEEQEKIALFFLVIYKKLEKEQEKLDSLNEWKKGLLQQMFV
ncbi:restriction endonuclease subunit S [Clostridium botulinum]|uniref:Type I restriction-modification enzyme, S subunit, EcoA family protein n=1 Tax=Clostridium botulinum CFSAN001627 TaxID=1232189 RepID=M1ZY74_CLOBO|nr:restriction endonuclease subunit S [Clostridium botulinum]EKN42363.1 type I restriction-modification enzyme, S subunit, EcoA family protein [Clostridium botulinum CFSAN001627]APC85542.1 type I restriction modification DNA specificity domain protein [Clostridium botulinum]AXG94639.1 restriction endonuclease subunit S [Clostridium botulinum]EDT81176.1 Sau1hsdS1 [Clostridium botulinum NCTC 2916]MBY6771737.1 restriction endonuclease subunit S [Clostridium botulinum]